MKIAINDWVMRVGYPSTKDGFTDTFEDFPSGTAFLVMDVIDAAEAVVVRLLVNGRYVGRTFWAGNLQHVTVTPILEGLS